MTIPNKTRLLTVAHMDFQGKPTGCCADRIRKATWGKPNRGTEFKGHSPRWGPFFWGVFGAIFGGMKMQVVGNCYLEDHPS